MQSTMPIPRENAEGGAVAAAQLISLAQSSINSRKMVKHGIYANAVMNSFINCALWPSLFSLPKRMESICVSV